MRDLGGGCSCEKSVVVRAGALQEIVEDFLPVDLLRCENIQSLILHM